MNTVDAVIRRIRCFALHSKLTKSRFAISCGLQVDVTRRMWDADWNPTAATLRKLESIIPPDYQSAANDQALPDAKAA